MSVRSQTDQYLVHHWSMTRAEVSQVTSAEYRWDSEHCDWKDVDAPTVLSPGREMCIVWYSDPDAHISALSDSNE